MTVFADIEPADLVHEQFLCSLVISYPRYMVENDPPEGLSNR